MVATVAGIHLGIDTHANRPAANTVPDGSIYSCSDHSLVYKSNFAGNSWATWATVSAAGGGIPATIVDAKGDVIAATAADTVARLAVGANGYHLVAASGETTGLKWEKGNSIKDFATTTRTAGNLTLNNTSWTDTSVTDLVLDAVSGDMVEVGLSAFIGGGAEAVNCGLDAWSIVSSTATNAFSGAGGAGGFGVQAWMSIDGITSGQALGGSILYTLVAGDISSSTVTIRLRYRTGTAANKTLWAGSNQPLHFWAKNLGAAL